MRSVLQAASYSNVLHTLQLFNIDTKSARKLFKNKLLSASIFRTQIKILSLTCNRIEYFTDTALVGNIFQRIFPIFSKLNYLILDDRWYHNRVRFYFDDILIGNFRSSTLLYLNIRVQAFRDCLYILDSRFNQLHTLIIDVINPCDASDVENRDYLPNLKYFSFTCSYGVYFNETIGSLLRRMSNLERLSLYIVIESGRGQCHIYSYPSQTTYLNGITNKFPGGLHKYVREVSLFDEKPFEHEFFLRIEKSSPSMEILSLNNKKSQNCKDSNENLSLIQYSSLRELRICSAHDDYMEEFLLDTKTCLSKNVDLYIKYESLERVTHNFMRESTRINCTKVDKLYFSDRSKCSNPLEEYFPNTKIINVPWF